MVEASFEGKTPSRQEFRKEIAANLKAKEELVIIKNINTEFGYRMAKVLVHVYKKKEDIEAVEPKYVMKRHEVKEKKEKPKPAPEAKPTPEGEATEGEPKVEDKPAEEPKAEALAEPEPAEKKKEETPPKEGPKAEEAPAEDKPEGEQ